MEKKPKRELWQKLGFMPGKKVHLCNEPHNYFELLGNYPDEVVFCEVLHNNINIVHFFTSEMGELLALLPVFKDAVFPDGMIWLSYPKGASKMETDIDQGMLRSIFNDFGMVDLKICAIDNNWTAMKFVVRKENRK